MTVERKTVYVSTYIDGYDFQGPVMDVVAKLQVELLAIPEEYRDSAGVAVKMYENIAAPYVEIYYERPEDDEEYANRVADEEQKATAQAEKERRVYEYLKAKFDSPRPPEGQE